jgi:hypothetical protein
MKREASLSSMIAKAPAGQPPQQFALKEKLLKLLHQLTRFILFSALLGVAMFTWASEKPVELAIGHVGDKDASLVLPSTQVTAAVILVLQIIWGLVNMLQKRQAKKRETHSYDSLMELVHRLDEKVKNIPTEEGIVRRIRSEMELIAIKTAQGEMDRARRSEQR